MSSTCWDEENNYMGFTHRECDYCNGNFEDRILYHGGTMYEANYAFCCEKCLDEWKVYQERISFDIEAYEKKLIEVSLKSMTLC